MENWVSKQYNSQILAPEGSFPQEANNMIIVNLSKVRSITSTLIEESHLNWNLMKIVWNKLWTPTNLYKGFNLTEQYLLDKMIIKICNLYERP